MEDGELVGLALAEPGTGFARMYDAYGSRLYDYCHGILRSGDEAADAVQDTFETTINRLDQLRDPAKLRPWLYAIARNHCFQRTRKRDREQSTDDLEVIMSRQDVASPSPAAPLEAAELQTLVWDAVGGLSEVDRAVVDLNVRHGLEGEELASALGVPASRAYVMVHRAKSRLEGSVSALLVARAGTEACPELEAMVDGDPLLAGGLTPLLRKRVTRHLRSCEVCQETERDNHPLTILALVPFVPAPPELRTRILACVDRSLGQAAEPASARAGEGDGTSGYDDVGWKADGFPRPIEAGRLASVGRLAAAGVGLAALVLLVALAPAGWIPTIGGEEANPSNVAAGPASSRESVEVSSTTQMPGRGDQTEPDSGDGSRTGSETTTTTSTETEPVDTVTTTTTTPADDEPPGLLTLTITITTTTTTTTARVLADLSPPSVSGLSVSCDDPFVLELTIVDDFDPAPTVDLLARWDDGPGQTIELTDQGGGRYRAVVPFDELDGETIAFLVEGTVQDRAGNRLPVSRTSSCEFIL